MKGFYAFENLIYHADQSETETFDEIEMRDAFANSLKKIREYCRLTMIKLAEEIDIPQPTICCYETKTRTPSILQAIKITAYFGLTVEEFILCGLEKLPYDIIELYERRNKGL